MKKPEALAHWLREQRDGKGLCGDGAGLRFYRSLPMPHHRFAHWCSAPITVEIKHDRTPVTTRHEKSFYANRLFAVSYGSFQGRP